MTAEALAAFALFAFASSITPGPNNLMLLASGARFGVRRTLPHLAGIGIGFVVLFVAVGLGLGGLLVAHPEVGTALRIACIAYLTVLAWRVATAPPPGAAEGRGAPLSLLEAAAFQWINPKGWAMALTAVGAYLPQDRLAALPLAVLVFSLVNIASVSTWAVAGARLARWLRVPARARAFNVVMATLLLASVAPVLL